MAEQKVNIVEAVGLQKIFKDFWGRPKATAVDGINFEIHQGEILGLLGPNGSGKSTTVKMLLGLLHATGGSLKVFGKPPDDVGNKMRIGYLPEETYLYKYLTAEETLDFFGSLFNIHPEERKLRTAQLLEMVGLSHAAKRAVGEFSKGMQRRIGLAQALINDPDLVILDEPTSGLDPIGCRDMKDLIKTLAKRNKTVILCSHLLTDVEDVCGNVLLMYGGKIRARGSLKELLQVTEQTQITLPSLSPELTEKVMALLNDMQPDSEIRMSKPNMGLEDFFIDVVNQARAEMGTSGAESTGKVATYLEEGDKSKTTLDSLRDDGLSRKAPPLDPPRKVEPNQKALSALADSSKEDEAKASKDEPAKPKADKKEVNKRLEDLMK
jgi:ABC-2 type transport system ATP-binding protein